MNHFNQLSYWRSNGLDSDEFCRFFYSLSLSLVIIFLKHGWASNKSKKCDVTYSIVIFRYCVPLTVLMKGLSVIRSSKKPTATVDVFKAARKANEYHSTSTTSTGQLNTVNLNSYCKMAFSGKVSRYLFNSQYLKLWRFEIYRLERFHLFLLSCVSFSFLTWS